MRSKWMPYVRQPEDDWSKVADGDDRKKIQNRLSQRARRATLKAKRNATSADSKSADISSEESLYDKATPSGAESPADEIVHNSVMSQPVNDMATHPPLEARTSQEVEKGLYVKPSQADPVIPIHEEAELDVPSPILDSNFIILIPIATVSAYTFNAALLQLSCTRTHPRIFDPVHFSMPPPLAPTQLQKTIPHPPFIDIIPFPGVRDRLLRSLKVIDQAKLSEDLVEDGFRVWGNIAWDGTGWEVTEAFARKWWFLIDESLLNTTNFWRRQRFETALLVSKDGEVSC